MGRFVSRSALAVRATLTALGAMSVFVVIGAAPDTARADCLNGVYDQTLPVASITPGDGATTTASASAAVQFMLVTPVHGAFLLVRVATSTALGQNGTLSDLNLVDNFALAETTTGHYQGVSNVGPTLWINTPGTYYWQASGTESHFDPGTGTIVCNAYASSVHKITVRTPGPPRITFAEARTYATAMVKQHTHRTVSGGNISCTRIDNWTLHCLLGWRAAGYSYHATGRFWHAFGSDGRAYWWANFRGVRTSLSCARRHPHAARCKHDFHWR